MAADLGDGKPGPGVRPAGQVEHPALLIPDAELRSPKPRKPARSVVLPENLKIGDTLAADSAPQIVGQPFSITCQIEPKARSGAIVAQGGSEAGYALYLKEGRLVFAVCRASRRSHPVPQPGDLRPDARHPPAALRDDDTAWARKKETIRRHKRVGVSEVCRTDARKPVFLRIMTGFPIHRVEGIMESASQVVAEE